MKRGAYIVVAAGLAMLTISPLTATHAHAQPAEDRCVGSKDETELAETAVRVSPQKRDSFLAAVRAHATAGFLGVGSATDERGWIILVLESRPRGVMIEVEAVNEANFRATAVTCNATQDWRPIWAAFERFIDQHRAEWRD